MRSSDHARVANLGAGGDSERSHRMNAVHDPERPAHRGSSAAAWGVLVVYFALAAFFLYLFYIRFFRWRDHFNELGRAYDPDGTGQVYTTSGMVWIIPAAVFLLLAVRRFMPLLRRSASESNIQSNISSS